MCLTNQFWNLTITGLAIGSVYALIALGYTMVYGVLQLINFAHSEVFMMGAFGGLFAVRAVLGEGAPSGTDSILAVATGVAAGALAGGATAVLLERVAYRPLRRRHAPRLAFLISAIGASLFISNLAGKEFGRLAEPIPALFENRTVFTVFGAPVMTMQLVIGGTALAMMLALDRVVARSRLGQGIRAVAQDSEIASVVGVDPDRVIMWTFLVGGLLGGAAGFLYGMAFNVSFSMGFVPGIKAFAAAVLGGIGNVRGAVLGGLLLGLAENYGVACVDSAYRDIISFLVLVSVLMVRPTGILGERLGRSG